MSISPASALEGNSGTTPVALAVTLSAASGYDTDVLYGTSNGTALAGSDYVAVAGALVHIPAGLLSGNANVSINGDTAYEPNEAFNVTLSSPSHATIGTGTAQATIANDDPPGILIGDVMASEGALGSTVFSFAVTLEAAVSQTVTVQYQTSDGTAVAGADYTAASGPVTFTPGVVSQSVPISVLGDGTSEGWDGIIEAYLARHRKLFRLEDSDAGNASAHP